MPERTEPALLLRRYRYGESSLVAHLFTRGAGRVHLVAKGAYRPTSGFCGVLDFFDTLSVTWTPGAGELRPLRRASIEARRHRLARDLERYRTALSALELLDLAASGPPEPRAFDLACATLDGIGDPAAEPAWALASFDLRLLAVLGLAPALERCAACGGPAPPVDGAPGRAAFSASSGGRLCLGCAREARAAGRRVGTLPVTVLALADELLLSGVPRDAVADDDAAGLRDFVRRFLEYHLETRPRSRQARRPDAGVREPAGDRGAGDPGAGIASR